MARILVCMMMIAVAAAQPARADAAYPRGCHQAVMPPGAHIAQGIATIVDERTIHVRHFTYDGTAPLVYFYLGADNTHAAFANGIAIGPVLGRAYADEEITVQLPPGQSLDGYTAISVWCAAFNVSFTSASFVPPTYARACQTASLAPGAHDAQGVATILDHRTIRVDHFTYDGTAPAVYFYLGTENTNAALKAGVAIGPRLTRPYNDETITVELPAGQSLDGYRALSVWCAAVSVSFTSAEFTRPPADFDVDGDVDADDLERFRSCATGPALGPVAPPCRIVDLNGDGSVDQVDFARFQRCWSGADRPASPSCAD